MTDSVKKLFKLPVFENLLQKFTPGSVPNSVLYRIIPSPDTYPSKTFRKIKRNGLNYYLNLSDLVDWYLFWGFKDPDLDYLYNLAKPGNTIIDIGSNKGHVAMKLALIAGESGKVFGFEASPDNFTLCQKNISLNNLKNLTVSNKGLGSISGTYYMQRIDENNTGRDFVTGKEKLAGNNPVSIEITRLDDLENINELKKIDLIKIDVEGFEEEVLKGAFNTIKKTSPILFIEIDNNNLMRQNSSGRSLLLFLQKLNYNSRKASTNEIINEYYDFNNCHFDIICEPN